MHETNLYKRNHVKYINHHMLIAFIQYIYNLTYTFTIAYIST